MEAQIRLRHPKRLLSPRGSKAIALSQAHRLQRETTAVGGLHLTGVVQVGGPPRTLRWRALQARWMSAGRWRGRQDLSWPLTGDDVAVAHGVVAGGELEHPVEDEPAALRAAAVEAEHELVKVVLQMRFVDRALVGAQKPPLGQRGDPVHGGQQLARVVAAGAGSPLAAPLVGVAEPGQPVVDRKSVV